MHLVQKKLYRDFEDRDFVFWGYQMALLTYLTNSFILEQHSNGEGSPPRFDLDGASILCLKQKTR
jgi:hypothetical protein